MFLVIEPKAEHRKAIVEGLKWVDRRHVIIEAESEEDVWEKAGPRR
jgi:hypothetical protein